MNNNIAAILIAMLIGLQNIMAALKEKRIAFLFTFSKWADKDI